MCFTRCYCYSASPLNVKRTDTERYSISELAAEVVTELSRRRRKIGEKAGQDKGHVCDPPSGEF